MDGAWLGHIHRITTPFSQRRITKDAWQILSEELGDGDINKNHVFLFRNLVHSIDGTFPDGDSEDFGDPRHGVNDIDSWKAAVAQLVISLFPNDFLPEILGFNLHYEQLTLQTLKAARELPQFGISGYYFHIHVSIDNADSGHTAMALAVVANYMRQVQETTSIQASQEIWRRIQAGYILSQALGDDKTPGDSSNPEERPLAKSEERLLDIFKSKARASHRIHCASKVKIGRRSLVEWLSPKLWDSRQWQLDFLKDLSEAKPWIIRGHSSKSLLIRELEWKGRMFGAFTDAEVKVLTDWIDTPTSIGNQVQHSYWQLIGCEVDEKQPLPFKQDLAVDHPVFSTVPAPSEGDSSEDEHYRQGALGQPLPRELDTAGLRLSRFLPLWFTHTCLLENYISTPWQTSTKLGQHIVRVLRADYGYGIETHGVAGMDEQTRVFQTSIIDMGLQIMRRHQLPEPTCLKDILTENDETQSQVRFAYSMLGWAMHPNKNLGFLLGLARTFLDLEAWMADDGSLLDSEEREALKQIVHRKKISLDGCLDEIRADTAQYQAFLRGYAIGRSEIEEIFSAQ